MIPLDHLCSSFVGLDEDLQCVISFALVPTLVDGTRARRTRSERDFIEALEAWLAPSQSTLRTVGRVVSAAAFGEVLSRDAPVRRNGSQLAQVKRHDHLEEALTRTVAEASALIEQSRREVERSRVLLNNEPRRDDGAPAPV